MQPIAPTMNRNRLWNRNRVWLGLVPQGQALNSDRSTPPSDFLRIIIEFGDDEVKAQATAGLAQQLWYDLCNGNIITKGMVIAGAEFTQANNLVLSVNPLAAKRFLQSDMQDQLRGYLLNALNAPRDAHIWIYANQHWPRAIIHHISFGTTFLREEDALRAVIGELTTYNPSIQETPIYILSKARFLQPFDNGVGGNHTASLCLPLEDIGSVQRLKKSGAFISGKRYKVSALRGNKKI